MTRPLLLDLFCGAGGTAVGYHSAGFDVVGVDHKPQKRYPFKFLEADALDMLRGLTSGSSVLGYYLSDFAAIHASPPCQGYSRLLTLPWFKGKSYPMLIDTVRDLLDKTGLPWIIENVEGAWKHMRGSVCLCGTMFGLKVYRHRLFLSNRFLLQPPHKKHVRDGSAGPERGRRHNGLPKVIGEKAMPRLNRPMGNGMVLCAGHQVGKATAAAAMEIEWMTRDELAQAIPPAYTEFIGRQLLNLVFDQVAKGES